MILGVTWLISFAQWPGGWINIKMSSYQCRKSHCGDKTILRPSYLHNGISYTDKMTSLYWIRALKPISKIVYELVVEILSTFFFCFNYVFNTLRPRQNGHRFADDTFKRIFLNENVRISIKFSLKFVPKGPINNIPALVQIMAWRRSGAKPLSEPMMVSWLTHICITRPQWVNRSCHVTIIGWPDYSLEH